MRSNTLWAPILALALVGGAVVALTQNRTEGDLPEPMVVPHVEPIAVIEAKHVTLQEPHVHWSRTETPTYSEATLLVLRTSPDRLVRRQTFEHVLFVGAETAERINNGDVSGYLIVIVPGHVDLAQAPVFFGEPDLPERVTLEVAEQELVRARSLGTRPLAPARAVQVMQPPVELADAYELYLEASFWIEAYSPEENDLVQSLRAPRLGR